MTEEEARQEETSALVASVQKGEPGAFRDLLDRYSALITRLINSFAVTTELRGEEKEDLRQEAAICLYRAAMTFDTAQQNVTFGLYAKICLKNKLISAARHAAKKRQKQARHPSVQPDETSALRQKEAYAHILEEAKKILSAKEKHVLALYVSGQSYMDIARATDSSVKSVDNALCRAKRKLREHLAKAGE